LLLQDKTFTNEVIQACHKLYYRSSTKLIPPTAS